MTSWPPPQKKEGTNNNDDSESALIGTLRRFLSRISVCLLHDEDAVILEKYTFPYCFNLMAKCTEILAMSNKECGAQKLALHQKAFIVDIFRYKMGELLSPMLAGIWSLDLSLTLCTNILPPIHRFIKTLSVFMADLPDCVRAEQQFIRSEFVTNTVKRDVVTESIHPVPRGLSNKTVSVPGAKSLKVTIDKQTFENGQNAVGCSLSFYKKPNSDLIGSFTSMPPKPLIVSGDSVYVVFSSGYSSSAWGFKLSVTAQIEEAQFDSPWILDLAQSASIIASKCIGSFISAKIGPKEVLKLDQGSRSKENAESQFANTATSRRLERKKTTKKKRKKQKSK